MADSAVMQVSLHGRRFGIDKDNNLIAADSAGELHVALRPAKDRVSAASTGATISGDGVSTLPGTGAVAYTLAAPRTGNRKVLYSNAGTTAARTVTLESGTFHSTAGSSQNRATFASTLLNGQSLTLEAISTALYAVVGNIGAVSFSTV